MAAATAALSPTRALRRPRRLDARALTGIFLAVLSTVGALVYWSVASDTREVLVSARELPTGAVVGSSDLAIARVRVDDSLYSAALPATERAQVVGQQLAAPAFPQQVLVRAQLAARPPLAPDQLAITIPVSADTAVGGRLRPGDVVQVLVTLNPGKPESRTHIVLPRANVYDVGLDDRVAVIRTGSAGGSGGSGAGERPGDQVRGAPATLTLAVTHEEARDLAWARWNGELDVALVPAPPAPGKAQVQAPQSAQSSQSTQSSPGQR